MLSVTEIQRIYINAKNGDSISEESLFQFIRVRFSAIAKQRLKKDYSEDIAHDACLTVLEKYKDLPSDIEFEKWAYKVLRNKIGNHMRNTKLRKSKLHLSNDIESVITHQNSSQNSSEFIDLKLKMIRCLRKLSEHNAKYILVLNLKHQGFTTNEICEKLNLTSSHFYVMLHRCRSILYNCIYGTRDNQ